MYVKYHYFSYALNIIFGLVLIILFGVIVAGGRVQPWEPDPIVAFAELLTGFLIIIYGFYGMFIDSHPKKSSG